MKWNTTEHWSQSWPVPRDFKYRVDIEDAIRANSGVITGKRGQIIFTGEQSVTIGDRGQIVMKP